MNGIIVKAYKMNSVIRVTIPKRVWEALGEPKEFKLRLEGGKIVLEPIRS